MLYLTPGITIYILTIAFILGAVFASFLGCMGWRLCNGESVLKGRSHCDFCGHTLEWRDLIPILSYLMRKGRCAYCNKPIPKMSLYGELVLAVVFVLTTMQYDITWKLALNLFFICVLYLISVTDIYEQIIPDSCLVAAVVVRILCFLLLEEVSLFSALAFVGNGLSISLPMLILVLIMEKIKKMEVMGGGDIKLLFVMGIYLGWANNLLALFLGCVTAIVVTYIKQKKEDENAYIAFGPFLSTGAVLAVLVGDTIITWYLSLFF